MKEFTKRIIAIAAVLCVAMTGVVGCSSGSKNSSSSSSQEVILQIPFEYGEGNDSPFGQDANAPDLEGDDPVAATTKAGDKTTATSANSGNTGNKQEATEVVTDANGQPATEMVPVTDAAGETVKDEKGQPVTQSVPVTQPAKKTDNSGSNNGNSGNNNNNENNNGGNNSNSGSNESSEPVEEPANDYKGKTEGRYAMWLDISRDENFLFEGDFLHVQFKIKDDVPAGDYSIRINPDIADISGRSVHEYTSEGGTVRINNGSIDAADPALEDESKMLVYGDNVAANSGDTIDYYINIKNNLGMCAFCIWFYYDANAMEFLSCEPSGEYSEIARQTEVGGQNSSKPIPEE